MKNKTKRYRNKTALIVSLCLSSGFGQAANYDISSQDLFAPSQEETQFKFDSMLENDDSAAFIEAFPFPEQDESQLTYQKETYQSILGLVKEQNLDQAEKKVNDLIKQFPEQPEFYNLHALIKILQKNTSVASASYKQALKLDPNNATALKGQAILLIKNDDLVSAQELINRVLANDSKEIVAYFLKANIAYRQNNFVEVEKVLSTALENVKGNINLELPVTDGLIRLYSQKPDSKKILSLAQDLEQRYPNDSRSLSLLAKAQIFDKQYNLGEQTLKRIISQDKQDITHRLLLAQLYMNELDDIKEASKLIDEALHTSPENFKALTFKTVFLTKQKQYGQAMELADQLENKLPQSAVGKMLKADIYLAQQQLDLALAYNQKAYEIEPDTKLFNNIIGQLTALGKHEEAIRFLQDELDKNPRNLTNHFKLASLYLSKKDYEKAEFHYQAILKEHPDNSVIQNNLAMVYYHQKNPKALDLAKKAYNGAPDSAAIADTYGIVLLQQGRNREALKVIGKAAELAPKSLEIQLNLAEAYRVNGNQKTAIAILEKIVDDAAESVTKQTARERLKQLKAN